MSEQGKLERAVVAQLAGQSRRKGGPDATEVTVLQVEIAALTQARRIADYEHKVAAIVAAAPPLTPEQIDRIGAAIAASPKLAEMFAPKFRRSV